MKRPVFLDQTPPQGYVAGIGRGATGFSSRGNKLKIAPKRIPLQSDIKITNEYQNETDKEDIEAENVYSRIDSKRNGRNKKEEKPKTQNSLKQFTDLKRTLKQVTEEEWLNIPEASDMTRRNKRNRLQEQLNRKTYAAPDALISKQVDLITSIEEKEEVQGKPLDVDPLGKSLIENGKKIAYDQSKSIETEKYLTQLESINTAIDASQSEEIKKLRTVFQSYRKSMPKEPQGWIASARLEEKAKRFPLAKKIITEGCQECPRSDEIWLENIRIHRVDIHKCKTLIATAIRFIPSSEKLWLKAVELESENINKTRVVRKALSEIPYSEKFWQLAILYETEKSESMRILTKALEFLPKSLDLWKALVNIQPYEEAKKSIKSMKSYIHDSLDVWIVEAQLEEKIFPNCIKGIFTEAFNTLETLDNKIDIFKGIDKAIKIESDGIAKNVLEIFISTLFTLKINNNSEVVSLTKYINKMIDCLTKILCLRQLLILNPLKFSLWQLLQTTCVNLALISELYKTYEIILFDKDTDYSALKETPTLVLLYAKDIWKYSSNPDKALSLIDQALSIIPSSTDIWFAKLKILCQLGRNDDIEIVFSNMFELFDNKDQTDGRERMFMKYVSFLRYMGRYQEAIEFVKDKCIRTYPQFYKFYLQIGQVYENDIHEPNEAISWYHRGAVNFPRNNLFQISLGRTYSTSLGNISRGRSILEVALSNSPKDEMMYQELIQLEFNQGNLEQANLLIEKALKVIPNSPVIWVEKLKFLSDRKSSNKKIVFKDALIKTKNNYLVLVQIALSFYQDGQYKVSEKWLQRAIKANPQFGDSWIWLCKTHQKMNKEISDCLQKVELYEPRYGSLWVQVTKNPKTQYLSPSKVLSHALELWRQ